MADPFQLVARPDCRRRPLDIHYAPRSISFTAGLVYEPLAVEVPRPVNRAASPSIQLAATGRLCMPRPIQQLTLAELQSLLDDWKPVRTIREVHIHCTDRPNHADFRGLASVEAMRRFHQSIGMNDIAQHLTVDPQGLFWTGRPFDTMPASVRGTQRDVRGRPFHDRDGRALQQERDPSTASRTRRRRRSRPPPARCCASSSSTRRRSSSTASSRTPARRARVTRSIRTRFGRRSRRSSTPSPPAHAARLRHQGPAQPRARAARSRRRARRR